MHGNMPDIIIISSMGGAMFMHTCNHGTEIKTF